MYLWQIKPQETYRLDNIFGNQVNDWYSEPISANQFNHIQYQSIDRIELITPPPIYGSRTMQPHIGNNESYYMGYIHNTANEPGVGIVTTAALDDMSISELGPLGPTDRIVNNTAPFYFYFGFIL